MTPASLAAALRTCAAGLYPLEAGVGLLIANGTFLHRDDFTSRFIIRSTSTPEDAQMAAVDWDAVATALSVGELPCSSGFSELKTIINIRCSRVVFRRHEGSRWPALRCCRHRGR